MQRIAHSSIRKAKGRQGFTLVEALVGIVVVGIVMTGLYTLMIHGMRTAQLAREDMRATQLLQEKLEKLRLYTWDQLTDTNTVPLQFAGSFNPEDPTLGDAGLPNSSITTSSLTNFTSRELVYSGVLEISDGPSDVTYGQGMKLVTVRINWTSSTGLRRQRAVTTYFAQYGLQNYVL